MEHATFGKCLQEVGNLNLDGGSVVLHVADDFRTDPVGGLADMRQCQASELTSEQR